jgi:hypothetical protein
LAPLEAGRICENRCGWRLVWVVMAEICFTVWMIPVG